MWLIVGVSFLTASVQSIEVTSMYSGFSGLVVATDVRVGSSKKKFRLSIDFNSDESFLYAPAVCPPFVGLCYNPVDSVTGRFKSQSSRGIRMEEEVQFYSDRAPIRTPFILVTSLEEQFREVAGAIAAGRKSQLLKDKSIIVLEDNGGNIRFRTTIPMNMGLIVDLSKYVIAEDTRWIIEGQLIMDGTEFASRIHIDSSQDSTIMPMKFKTAVLDKLHGEGIKGKVNNGGQLVVDCERSKEVDSMLKLWIQFTSRPLRLHVSHENGDNQTCLIKIRFDSNIPSDTVIVGRDLLRSVSYIVLDYVAKIVGFRLRLPGPPASAVLHPVTPLIPLFGFPEIIYGVNYGPRQSDTNIVFSKTVDGTLALASVTIIPSIGRDDQKLSCWSFIHLGPPGMEPWKGERHVELPGVFKGASLKIEDDKITVNLSLNKFNEADRLRASFVLSHHRVSVCLSDVENFRIKGSH
jgi:hypothetical protein